MAGASDISTILSQSGRIEKINQSPFAQSEVTKQILTEEEARERLRKSREVNEARKSQEIAAQDRKKRSSDQGRERKPKGQENETVNDEPQDSGVKHIIDVVV